MSDPFVSVIVLGWGGEKYISTCMKALSRQTYSAYEIIVVDNASPDRTAEIVERDFPHVRLIRTERNLGVAGGNNVGLRAASGDILILTNVDTEARPDWIERLVEVMLSNSTIGIAGSKLLYPDGRIQYGGGRIVDVQGFARHVDLLSPDRPDSTAIQETDFATGASLAMRREALEQIGFEDEAYFPIDYEDPDICYRARLAGWRVCYVPSAASIHYESSTVQPLAPHRMMSAMMGRLRFVCKFWSDEQLQGPFIEAEEAWLRALSDLQSTPAIFTHGIMPLIYLKTLLDVDDLATWRERLGVSDVDTSRRILSEVLTRLRLVSLPQFQSSQDRLSSTAHERVHNLLEEWLADEQDLPGKQSIRGLLQPISTLSLAKVQVNSHLPIAWPYWPRGVWPKVKAALQKVTRRLLSWYVNPIVEQQNRVNLDTLQMLNATTQELFLLRREWAAREQSLRAEIEALRQSLGNMENDRE